MTAGRVGSALVVTVRPAGGASGPEAARRLFALLDHDRVWCLLTVDESHGAETEADRPASGAADAASAGLAAQWDAAVATLPPDWSDLLCSLQLESSDLLPRVALLCAPVNPTRAPGVVGFVFRCARRAGYGVSPAMAHRCFARVDEESIAARVEITRVLSDTHNVATQGPVWLVGGKVL